MDFFDQIADMSGPALDGFGDIVGDIAGGLGGLLLALKPIAGSIGGTIGDLAERFAAWGTSVGEGGSLDSFLNFLIEEGLGIASDLADIAEAVALVAAAPLGVRVPDDLGKVARGIEAVGGPVIRLVGLLTGLQINAGDVMGALKDLKPVATDVVEWIARKFTGLAVFFAKLDLNFHGMFDGIKEASAPRSTS